MSIDLTTASPLENASIQYTYPEMDIRGIQTANGTVKKFFFRNGLSSSSFSFTDSGNSIYKSGIASEGIISNGNHNNSHELTIKHITNAGDLFYVVFPITSGSTSSFIDKIIKPDSDINVNVINMGVENKSLNSMINASKVYKYTNDKEKLVFVFETPIKTSNNLNSITDSHSEWSGVSSTSSTINIIDLGSSEKVTEEIVCDSTGDTEQTINNEPLNRGAAKIGWTTLVFIMLATWIGYFYSIPFVTANIVNGITFWGGVIIFIAVLIPSLTIGLSYGLIKNKNKLSMYRNPVAILFFLFFLWPIDFVFRIFTYGILTLLNTIINFDNDLPTIGVFDFVKGYLNSPNILGPVNPALAAANTSAKYALYVLFAVWLVAIFAIVSK
jgi:hypothetical protein